MAMQSPTPAPKRPGGRWLALDLLRFCAVFLMVQGHTFTELLDPIVRDERWYRHHNFVHGYTAPMFLFASGLAFGFTTFRNWESNLERGPALRKRFKRYGWLLLIGYTLHLPSTSLVTLATLSPERIRSWLQVDVLQHIAVSLAICQSLVVITRTPRRFIATIAVLFAIVVFGAPAIWRADVSALPAALAGFVDGASGSLFPLVPWAGFTYAGIGCAYAARGVTRPSEQLALPFLGFALLLLVGPVLLHNTTGWNPFGVHDFWRTGPYFFLFRLGNVVLVLALLCFAERWIDRAKLTEDPRSLPARALGIVRVVGQESLVIYVGHLLVLHGSVVNRGVRSFTGRTLSLPEASLVALLLFLAMVVLAKVWTVQKAEERKHLPAT